MAFQSYQEAAEEVLQLCIHEAAAPPAGDDTQPSAPPPAAAATAAATVATTATDETAVESCLKQQQQQQGLRLRSFSSSLPKAVDMLAALQVQHLTHVELGILAAKTDSSALSMALARFSNLQQLQLGYINASLGAALTTLVQLPQLTLLKCVGPLPWDSQV
jgi:hypothetical protein